MDFSGKVIMGEKWENGTPRRKKNPYQRIHKLNLEGSKLIDISTYACDRVSNFQSNSKTKQSKAILTHKFIKTKIEIRKKKTKFQQRKLKNQIRETPIAIYQSNEQQRRSTW